MPEVFDHDVLPCSCVFAPGTDQERQVPIERLSARKAIIDASEFGDAEWEANTSYSLHVKLPIGKKVALRGTIVAIQGDKLFLRWDQSPAKEKALDALLETAVEQIGARVRSSPAAPANENLESDSAEPEASAPSNDLRARVLSQTKTIRSSDLAARSENVRVLGMTQITALIQRAVDEALANSDRAWDEEERQRLLEEAEESFSERLAALRAEKAGVESQVANLQQQLERAQGLLDEERERVVEADQFTVSDAGMAELDKKLGRLFDHAVRAGSIDSADEEEMRQVVANLLDTEREKITQRAREAQSDAIELLERKIGRLSKSLEDTQRERDTAAERARLLEASGGSLGNVFQAGMAADDPNKDKKLGLLKDLVADNRAVRSHLQKKNPALAAAAPSSDSSSNDSPGGVKKMPLAPPAESSGGVKKIALGGVKPPPLERA